MKRLKPSFVSALANFIDAHSHQDAIENEATLKLIVNELEYAANHSVGMVLFPDQQNPSVFTGGYRYEGLIGGEIYNVVASIDNYETVGDEE
jgi:hypothetical protein